MVIFWNFSILFEEFMNLNVYIQQHLWVVIIQLSRQLDKRAVPPLILPHANEMYSN